jgi:hypothetical protein
MNLSKLHRSSNFKAIAAIATIVGSISVTESVRAATINFDTDANGNALTAPDAFSSATNLTNLYSSLGITFSSSSGANNGGAILDQSSNFAVNARSGTNFLAFNRLSGATFSNGGRPIDPEVLSFSTAISDFSVFASGGFSNASFQLQAFDAGNTLLGSSTINILAGSYGQLNFVSVSSNISTIILTQISGDNSFVYDDLSFNNSPVTSVPEPFTVMGTLIGGTAAIRMRNKLKLNRANNTSERN